MINIRNKLIVILIIALAFPHPGYAQESLTNELHFEVSVNYPPLSISKEKLNKAHTLTDLNRHYKSSYVKKYITVKILTTYKGKISKAVSKNDTLSQEQKDNMKMADVGTDISVKVQYIPDNTFTHNDIKEINFSFMVNPDSEAQYPGGQEELNKYLKENAIDKISDTSFKELSLAAIKFTINEEGQISDAHVFWTSEDEEIDELLLETIYNMPGWKPAEYSNGIKIKQEFVFLLGSMENCVVNLLNIRQD